MDDATFVIRGPGDPVHAQGSMTAETIVSETVRSPDSRSLFFDRDIVRMTIHANDQTLKQVARNPLHRARVTAQRGTDGRWSYDIDGRSPTAEEKVALQELAEEEEDGLYPAEAVRPGYGWEVPPEFVAATFGAGALGASGDVYLTFEEVVDYNRERCARIRMRLNNVEVRTVQDGGDQTMELGGTGLCTAP